MRRKILSGLTIFLILAMTVSVFLPLQTFASKESYLTFDGVNATISVRAKLGDTVNQAVTVVVTKETAESFTYDGEDTLTDFIRTGEAGSIDIKITVPSFFSSGKYYLYLFGRNEEKTDFTAFSYINQDTIKQLIPSVNAVSAAAQMTTLIQTHAEDFVLENTLSQSFLADMGSAFYSFKKQKGGYVASDVSGLLKDFNLAQAVAKIKNGYDIAIVIRDYANYLNLDYEQDYNILSQQEKEYLNALLFAADYSDSDLSTLYRQLAIYTKVKNAASYQKLQAVIETPANWDFLNLSLTYYNQLKDKSTVYQKMMYAVNSLEEYADIAPAFYTAAKAAFDSIGSTTTGGNGGASSGSGKGSGSVSVPNNVQKYIKPAETVLSDISGHWAETEIQTLVNEKILNGYEDHSFLPNASINRAEFVKIMVSAFGLSGTSEQSFTDVSLHDWYAPYISTAVKCGIVNGVSDKNFAPENEISRQDAAVMLYRLLSTQGKTLASGTVSFTDEKKITTYAKEGVSALCKVGILKGFEDNSFRPNTSITRAEAAVLIQRCRLEAMA